MEKIRTFLRRGEEAQMPARQAVSGLLGLLGFSPDLYAVFEIWDREVRGVVRGCEAAGLQGSRLCVRVPSPAHRQELMYMKDRLIARVNQAMGRRALTDVQFELICSDEKKGVVRDERKIRNGLERAR